MASISKVDKAAKKVFYFAANNPKVYLTYYLGRLIHGHIGNSSRLVPDLLSGPYFPFYSEKSRR